MGSCSEALDTSNKDFGRGPHLWLKDRLVKHGTFESSPIASRFAITAFALPTGAAKVVLFPIMVAVGIVVRPIMAGYHGCSGNKNEATKQLIAWSFCLLSGVAIFTFLALVGFSFPLMVSVTLVVAAIVASIVKHIYDGLKPPEILI